MVSQKFGIWKTHKSVFSPFGANWFLVQKEPLRGDAPEGALSVRRTEGPIGATVFRSRNKETARRRFLVCVCSCVYVLFGSRGINLGALGGNDLTSHLVCVPSSFNSGHSFRRNSLKAFTLNSASYSSFVENRSRVQ